MELCANLYDGGTTPSAGLIAAVKSRIRIPVFVLIRPRGGGFVYADEDADVMKRDVKIARAYGADGIVIGALDVNGRVSTAITGDLIEEAGGLPVTFHRAFDCTSDQAEALEMLIEAGVGRVLTSGGVGTALDGADSIARLVAQAAGRIVVMAGGGIREHNVREVIARTGVTEVHARISSAVPSTGDRSSPQARLRKPLPDDENAWEELDETRMRTLIGLTRV